MRSMLQNVRPQILNPHANELHLLWLLFQFVHIFILFFPHQIRMQGKKCGLHRTTLKFKLVLYLREWEHAWKIKELIRTHIKITSKIAQIYTYLKKIFRVNFFFVCITPIPKWGVWEKEGGGERRGQTEEVKLLFQYLRILLWYKKFNKVKLMRIFKFIIKVSCNVNSYRIKWGSILAIVGLFVYEMQYNTESKRKSLFHTSKKDTHFVWQSLFFLNIQFWRITVWRSNYFITMLGTL